MGRGLRSDLVERLDSDFECGMCTVPESRGDERRLEYVRRAGHVISPAPSLFVRPEDWLKLKPNVQHRYMVRSLAKLHPSWVFCHASAAIMHGLYVSYSLLDRVHVLTSRSSNSASKGIIARHKTCWDESDTVDGVRVTPVARTAFDCLRMCDFRTGLAIADSSLLVLDQNAEQLVDAFGAYPRQSFGWRRAVDIARFADRRSESGGESVARAVMIEQGYRIPNLQVEVENHVDACAYRIDFCWEIDSRTRVLGELDGREKYQNLDMTHGREVVDVLADERLRESRVSMAGDKIMRFSYKEVVDVGRFRVLLDAYGVPKGYAVPAVANPSDPINRAALGHW